MLKEKMKCPICGKEFIYNAFNGKIEKTCTHKIRVKAKLNAVICMIFTFMAIILPFSKMSKPKESNEMILFAYAMAALAIALIAALIIIVILYKIFGFENLYKVEAKEE